MADSKASFKDFINKFPKIDLPITLSEESHLHFSKAGMPLPAEMIRDFLEPLQKEPSDEFTEFQPCFRIPKTKDFHAIVYWKASLLTYQYLIATFTKKGVLIEHQVLSGTQVENNVIARTVATINDNWNIFIVGGVEQQESGAFSPTESEAVQLELQESGQIIVQQGSMEEG